MLRSPIHPSPTSSLSRPLSLVNVIFYRGITVQSAVERYSQNRSNYAICAVNPSRIGKILAKLHSVRSSKSWVAALMHCSRSSTTTSMDHNMLQRATFWRCKPSRTFSLLLIPTLRCDALPPSAEWMTLFSSTHSATLIAATHFVVRPIGSIQWCGPISARARQRRVYRQCTGGSVITGAAISSAVSPQPRCLCCWPRFGGYLLAIYLFTFTIHTTVHHE